jgi:hypothetical protein
MHSNKDGHILSTPGGGAPAQQTRFLGPAQRRYGDYFLSVLSSPELQQPDGLTKVLRQVVFSPFLPREEDGKLFLVVYQHGNSIWAGPPSSEVSRAVKTCKPHLSALPWCVSLLRSEHFSPGQCRCLQVLVCRVA